MTQLQKNERPTRQELFTKTACKINSIKSGITELSYAQFFSDCQDKQNAQITQR